MILASLKGSELADLLGVSAAAISKATKNGHLCAGHPVSEWAQRSESGRVKCYLVDAALLDTLRKKGSLPGKVETVSISPRLGSLEHKSPVLLGISGKVPGKSKKTGDKPVSPFGFPPLGASSQAARRVHPIGAPSPLPSVQQNVGDRSPQHAREQQYVQVLAEVILFCAPRVARFIREKVLMPSNKPVNSREEMNP